MIFVTFRASPSHHLTCSPNNININIFIASRQRAGRDYDHESTCLVCWDGGDLVCCDGCPAAYHLGCIGNPDLDDMKFNWHCLHHECVAEPDYRYVLCTSFSRFDSPPLTHYSTRAGAACATARPPQWVG